MSVNLSTNPSPPPSYTSSPTTSRPLPGRSSSHRPSSSSPSPTSPAPPVAHPQPQTLAHPAFRHRRSTTAVALAKQHAPTTSTSTSTLIGSPESSPIKMTTTLPSLPLPTIHDELHSAMSTPVRRIEEMAQGDGFESEPLNLASTHRGRTGRGSRGPVAALRKGLTRFTQTRVEADSMTPSRRTSYDDESAAEQGEATPLLHESDDTGAAGAKWYKGPLFMTGVKLSILFVVFTAIVLGTFWFGMPKVDPEDKDALKLPRSFADIQALNAIFQKYKSRYPFRILACGVVSYLFVQTFSLPGSMYISILFGAAYGIITGLFLSCLCDSFGSLLCYTLSSLLAPPLLALPYYRARVEAWRSKIMGKPGHEVGWDGVFAFLIVLRIAPFPPHWVANFVAPHLGISMLLFWTTCFIGIAPVSVIHVTIGSSLDKMTSADDFHILSVRNVLGLCGVIVAVLIPVGLKRVFRKDLGELGEAEEALEAASPSDTTIGIHGPVPLEFDEHGVPRRYQAVDSGVVLAGPSGGDPNLDIDAHPNPSRSVKGKGRAIAGIKSPHVQIPIIDVGSDSDEATLSESVEHANPMRPEKGKHNAVPIRGYGTIEPAPAAVEPFETSPEPARGWWRRAR